MLNRPRHLLAFLLLTTASMVAQSNCVSTPFPTTTNLLLKLPGYNACNYGTQGYNPNFTVIDGLFPGGVLSIVRGGTGTSTPALIAGTNVTITGTWPNQTINASGSGGGVTSVFSLTGTVPNLSGDVTTSNSAFTTLATVNSNVGSFTGANITVDAKGRITAAANGTSGTVASGTQGQPAIYTATGTAVGSSNQTVDASAFSGTHWTDKVVAAYTALGVNGGKIVVPDSIADNGSATALTIPTNVTIETPGSATFTACVINLGQFSKWYNTGDAYLQWSGSNCGMIGPPTIATLQTSDRMTLSHVRINCAAQTAANGMKIQVGTARAEIISPEITGCTDTASAAIYFDGAQFVHVIAPHLYNNYVGIKLYSTTGGGGNSITVDKGVIVLNTVGVLQSDRIGNIGQSANIFNNTDILSSGCQAIAIFGNSFQSSATWYGGSPEVNGNTGNGPTCTLPLTIDSNTITTQNTVYLSNGKLTMQDVINQDTNYPWANLLSGSALIGDNYSGYGKASGLLFQADSTSSVNLNGSWSAIGTATGITSFPSTIRGTTANTKLLGSAILEQNSKITNLYPTNPLTITLTDCAGGSASTATDPLYGTVVTCAQSSTIGDQNTNRWRMASAFGSLSGNQDFLACFLIKSSVDVAYQVGFYGDNNTVGTGADVATLPLKAGVWQRLCLAAFNKANTYADTGIVGFPRDTSAPTISLFGIETLAYPTGTQLGQQQFSTILQSGALNPNGFGTAWQSCNGKGLGDGLNAIAAGTYLQFACVNTTGKTITVSGIRCYTDNAGTSSMNVANNAGTSLLTGAVTCNNTKASGGNAGTQSGTTTLASGDALNFTFVADGTSKQTNWTITATY